MAATARSGSRGGAGGLFFLFTLLCLVCLASSRLDDDNLVNILLLNLPLLWETIQHLFAEAKLPGDICFYLLVIHVPKCNCMLILLLGLQKNLKENVLKKEKEMARLQVSHLAVQVTSCTAGDTTQYNSVAH